MSAKFDPQAVAARRLNEVPFSGIRKVFDAVTRLPPPPPDPLLNPKVLKFSAKYRM